MRKNQKKMKLDEFLPIYAQVKKEKDAGSYEDFMEVRRAKLPAPLPTGAPSPPVPSQAVRFSPTFSNLQPRSPKIGLYVN